MNANKETIRLQLIGNVDGLTEGICILSPDYGFIICEDGMPVHVTKAQEKYLSVSCDGASASIQYGRPCEFFRALGLLLEHLRADDRTFSISENAYFDTCGSMIDLSHGALMTVDAIKSVLRKMAMMGLNMFMLYREECYYVPGYEYFGYMRGRHTDAQIKEIDDYAYSLGIEIIPAIQTLGHLSNTLRWHSFGEIKDTFDCLLVGEEKTYEFIEAMIKAAKAPLRSNRIHIGFDETMSLGSGNYIMKNGYRPRVDIYCEHLNRVYQMVCDLGLSPMIWSDMFFRMKGSTESYAIDNDRIPEEVVQKIPEHMELVEACYSASAVETYRKRLQAHTETGKKTWFAGAVHDWHGFCVNYYHTLSATKHALLACKEEGIQDVFATTWGDDSTERDFFCNLLGFQYYAEHMYAENPDWERVKERFDFCGQCSSDMIIDIANIDNPHHTPLDFSENDQGTLILDGSGEIVNPSKYLCWQDPIAGLFDVDAAKVDFRTHFTTQKTKLLSYVGKFPEFEKSLHFYICLCDLLIDKCDFGIRLKHFYDEKDLENLRNMAESEVPALLQKLEALWLANRELWFERHQAFGFDVLERRYGCLQMRLKTTAYRIMEFLNGNIPQIEELEEKRLSALPENENVAYFNDYLLTSTAWGR